MTNTPDLLEKIRAKIIEAVPELAYECDCEATESNPEAVCKNTLSNIPCRPIRLVDVLLAIPKYGLSTDITANFMYLRSAYAKGKVGAWNLRKDSAEDQSPECIAFISSVLGVV